MSEAIRQSREPVSLGLLIEEVNSQEVLALYPLLFFYATILIVGVLGNALVLLVYSFRYRRSPARVYILFLAAIDFLMCLVGLPYHMIDMTHPYTYTNATACKSLTFIITTLFHMSIFGLIVIAIDRYLKICRPLGKVQISYFGKRRACGAAILAAIMMSWPNIVLYGPSEMESLNGNVTGYACFFETSYLETNYPFIYTLSTLCICIGSTIFLVVSYSLIVHKICTRYKCNRVKLTGKSAFDDTTLTEEVYFRNGNFPETNNRDDVQETKFSKSAEELNRYKTTNDSNMIEHHSDDEHLDDYKDRFVQYNSNGSLTFFDGGELETCASLQSQIFQHINKDETTKPLLSNTTQTSISGNPIDPCLSGQCLAQCEEKNIMNLSVESDLSSGSSRGTKGLAIREPFDKTSIEALNILRRKDKRYSLQVPDSVTPLKKTMSFRRKSDLTDIHSNRITQNWKRCSAIALGNVKQNSEFQEEGLRIHNSCQSVNTSSQGTFKAKKTVTKQHSKITKIMLTITIIFILSYSPAIVVTIWTAVQPEFWDILNEQETIVCEFLLRFYLINNICNPFIYGFWDKRFKREIIYTFRKLSTSFASKIHCCILKKSQT